MAQAAASQRFSYEEYLALERTSADKHEFVAGEIFAMAGGTRRHSLLCTNLLRELSLGLRDRPCLVFNADLRVKTADGTSAYPDGSALCGEPEFSSVMEDELLNPSLIVEVLSPSTASYDRGDKFVHYGTMPSLLDYVLISSDQVLVEVFTRQESGWLLRRYGWDETIPLASVGCEISVREIYRKVLAEEPGTPDPMTPRSG